MSMLHNTADSCVVHGMINIPCVGGITEVPHGGGGGG